MSTAQQTQQQPPLQNSPTTCVVGCKLPHGIICTLYDETGTKKLWEQRIKGKNESRIVGGYGLTDGVNAEAFTEWLRRNEDHLAVKNGSIFMHSSVRGAEGRAKEGRAIKTGLEPIDPLADGKRFGLTIDKDAEAAYRKQMAENPVRDRQIQE